MRRGDEDYTDRIGPLDSGAPWEMYSFERAAYEFWNGLANGLRTGGLDDDEIRDVLQSKLVRWLFDHEGEQVEALGRRMGKRLAREVIEEGLP